MLQIDGYDDGSVGSEDTTDCEDSGDERASQMAAGAAPLLCDSQSHWILAAWGLGCYRVLFNWARLPTLGRIIQQLAF